VSEIFFRLLIGHAAADFWAQSDTMAKGKNRHRKTEPPPGAKYQPTWMYWLLAHALIHGGAVWMATGSVGAAISETLAHAAIDFGKCENWYGIHTDQALHIACKLAWLLVWV